MKKYLILIGNLLLFIAIHYLVVRMIFFSAATFANMSKAIEEFLSHHSVVILIALMGVTVLGYWLVFKLEKRDLLKTCNFSPMNFASVGLTALIGIWMTFFTTGIISLRVVNQTLPFLQNYLAGIENGSVYFPVMLCGMLILIVFEEIIFRGVLFNEFRRAFPNVWAVLFQAVIYGIFNILFNPHWSIGVYAFLSALFYVIPYLWTGSLWGAILVQGVSLAGILLLRNTKLNLVLEKMGDPVLMGIIIAAAVLMGLTYYLLWVKTGENRELASQKVNSTTTG